MARGWNGSDRCSESPGAAGLSLAVDAIRRLCGRKAHPIASSTARRLVNPARLPGASAVRRGSAPSAPIGDSCEVSWPAHCPNMGRGAGRHLLGAARRRGARGPYRWRTEVIEAELRAFCAGRSEFPTLLEFDLDGRSDLRCAIVRSGGVAHWAQRVGLPVPARRRRGGGSASL